MGDDTSGHTSDHWYGERTDQPNSNTSVRSRFHWLRTAMVLLALALLFLSIRYASASKEATLGEQYETPVIDARGLFCDTEWQLAYIVRYWDGDGTMTSNLTELVGFVNETYQIKACGITHFTLLSYELRRQGVCEGGEYRIFQVKATAVYSPNAKKWMSFQRPIRQFFLQLTPLKGTEIKPATIWPRVNAIIFRC